MRLSIHYAVLFVASVALATELHAQSHHGPDSKTLFAAAFKLYQSGDFESASELFKKGLSLDPKDGRAHYYLAESLEKLRKVDESTAHYGATVQLIPDTEEGVLAGVKLSKRNINPASFAPLPATVSGKVAEINEIVSRSMPGSSLLLAKRAAALRVLDGCMRTEYKFSLDEIDWAAVLALDSSKSITLACRDQVDCVKVHWGPANSGQADCSSDADSVSASVVTFPSELSESKRLLTLVQSLR